MKTPPQRLVHDPEGLNSGSWPPPTDLITPTTHFFTRSHAPVPTIDPGSYRLQVTGLVQRSRTFSLKELLQSFPRRTVAATLVCAGLRRDEFLSLGPMPGEPPGGPEPASTGEWPGAALGDLLRQVGWTPQARHVELTGLDRVERHNRSFGFGASMDLEKGLGDEVLLATHLNGAPLPPAHGFPLRAVVPGWIGARSVKWLGSIVLRSDPTENYFQTQAYRMQRELNPRDPRDVSAGVALSELPVNSVILDPQPDRPLPAGRATVRGWAMGSSGRTVIRVEVSLDLERWAPARLLPQDSAWTWTLWEAEVDLVPGQHTLMARATDSSGATQPETIKETWNVKGYVNNAWHRVSIFVR